MCTRSLYKDTASNKFARQDDLHSPFALCLSATYVKEVPLYRDMVQIVQENNKPVLVPKQ